MKNNRLSVVLLAGLLLPGTIFLGGCKNISNAATEWTPPSKSETEESGYQESDSRNSKDLVKAMDYVKDTFTKEDYIRLAGNYGELGLVRMQRDTLEQGYRLFGGTEFLDLLEKIYVNLAEEDEAIAGEAATLYQNMELTEYLAESLHLAEDDIWFQTMMPKLSEGSRNYFQSQDGQNKLVISVGYDADAVKYTNAWFYTDRDKVLYISYSNQLAQVLETETADGQYNGSFELWTLNGYNGNILKETGEFVNGTVSEEGHTARIHQGQAKADVFDLWNNKEDVKYFELQEADRKARSGLAQIKQLPACDPYEPVDTKDLKKNEPQVRVYDGQIQYLTDKGWISLGSAETYAAADPFTAYAEEKKQIDAQVPAEREKEPQLKPASDSAQTDTRTQTTTKPTQTQTTTKPAQTQPTQPQPAATPASTPQVSQPTPAVQDDDHDDGDNGGDDGGNDNADNGDNGGGDDGNAGGDSDNGGDSGSNDNGGSDNSGGDGGNDGGDNGDNDAEIGWGEDLL